MRRMVALLSLAAVFALACGGPEVDPETPFSELTYQEQGVPFIDADRLHAWMEAGHADDVVFIDNRNAYSFEQQRIRGARLIPTSDVQNSLGKLPVNKWAVHYCT
ncbi:MAG: hypothetical protein KY397_03130 [Gemmatimonadetes bacterium]|nr:hypothetical protein [Gemmatimonadota bacterium]